MTAPHVPVLALLRDVDQARHFDAAAWNLVLPQLRHARLLAHVAALLQQRPWWGELPDALRRQCDAALVVAEAQRRSLVWEVGELARAFGAAGIPFVVLKGGAYVLAGVPPGLGREMSDLDVLVPHERLTEVRSTLLAHGWTIAEEDPENRRYFEQWQHQLPAFRHVVRRTMLDVHHHLIAPTGRFRSDAAAVLRDAVKAPGHEVLLPSPPDLILGAAAHFVRNKDGGSAIRDVLDGHELLECAGGDPDFWARLLARARETGLGRPLWFLLLAREVLLGSAPPPEVREVIAGIGAPAPVGAVLALLLRRGLVPDAVARPDAGTRLARKVLYVMALRAGLPVSVMVSRTVRRRFEEACAALRGEAATG
ncbi:MAG: nucleotidyltransferase domain-containing protein [Gemmatimonadota bacterium]